MTVALLIVFAIGASGLNGYPIRTDELFTVSNIGGFDPPFGPLEILDSIITYSPDHVPLFFLLSGGWASLVGWTQLALRMFSLLLAVMMIAWLYRFGADVFDRRSGLIASALMGTSAYLMLHFHDFRMYPLLLLLGIIHSWLYWRLAHGQLSGKLVWVLFAVSALALVYTHSTALVLFAGLGAYHLSIARRSLRWVNVIVGWAIAAIIYIPYLSSLLTGIQDAAQTLNEKTAAASVDQLVATFLLLLSNGSTWLLSLLVMLLAIALLRKRDAALSHYLLIPMAMLAAIIVPNEIFGFIPLSRMRYFIILWFPFVVFFARGLSLLPRWKWITLFFLLFWSAAGFQFYRSSTVLEFIGGMAKTRNYPPLQDYVIQLLDRVRSEEFLLGFTRNYYVNFDQKHGKSVADFYTQAHLGIDGAFVRSRAIGPWLVEEMTSLIDRHPYLLFTYEPQNKPDGFQGAVFFMQSNYRECDLLLDTNALYVRRYVNPLLDCDRQYAPIAYDNGVIVVDRFAKYLPEKDTLRILTGWEVPDEQLLVDYNVSLQIITPDWQNARQMDRHLYDNLLKWNMTDLSTDGVAPGDYRLMIILYHKETGEKVSGLDVNSGEFGPILPILSFTIDS